VIRLVAGVCVLLLGAVSTHADEAPRTPAITAGNWELLPLNDLERQELHRDHAALVRQVTLLGGRLKKLRGHRAARENPNDDAGRRIGEQADALAARLRPLLAQVLEALDDDAIDARLLAHIRAAPPGPARVARYAATVPLHVDGMPDAVRALLAHVVPRLDGALLALEARKASLRTRAPQAGLAQDKVNALIGGLDVRIRLLERRYWRLIDYVVPEAQRVAIHQRVPTAYQKREDVLQHLYALPGLSASQGTRLRAVLEEVQAQAAPDTALVKRLRVTQAEQADRRAAQAQIAEAGHRITALHRWASDQAKTILTPAQWASFEAIPPRVTIQDRKQTSVQLLQGVPLAPAQTSHLQALRDELRTYRKTYRERRLGAAARLRGMGPDSPQMAGAQMAMAAVEADANVVQRRFNGRVFLELLTPDQVAAWIVAPPADAR